MNGAELHLILNHLPVIVPLVGAVTLLFGILGNSSTVRKVGLWILVVGALTAIPTYLTGDPAEDVVKKYPWADRNLIHEHEELGEKALILIEVIGVASLSLLFALRKGIQIKRVVWYLLFVASVVSIGLFMATAHKGGLIHHEEIRTDELAPNHSK